MLCLTTADLSGTLLLMKSSAQESKSGGGAEFEIGVGFLSSNVAEKYGKCTLVLERNWILNFSCEMTWSQL